MLIDRVSFEDIALLGFTPDLNPQPLTPDAYETHHNIEFL